MTSQFPTMGGGGHEEPPNFFQGEYDMILRIAEASEMRELEAMGVITVYKRRELKLVEKWRSWEGAPNGCHIRWDGEGWASMRGTADEFEAVRAWIVECLHTGNE